jgi:glycosyltransferase involved in cell wall biosynthesis
MGDYRARGLTNGFLPEAAFLHLAPTAIGYLDLGAPLNVQHPAPESALPGCRDALLLVRLHGEPLAIIHVDGPPERTSAATLSAAIWDGCAEEIRSHCERFACRPKPHGAEELLAGLAASRDGCPGARPASEDASVTVVIPTHGHPHKLGRCLRTLLYVDFANFDVVVVDNRPGTPGTRDVVAAFAEHLPVRYVAEPRPGSSVARNRGLSEASSEFVAFADDDVLLDAGWLGWLLDPFADPAVLAVAGMILPLELRTESQKRLEQYAGFSKGVAKHTYDLNEHRARNRLLYPYWGGMFGAGASMAFRRADLLSVGGFDPALGVGSPARAGADIEAFTAAILRGGRVVYQPRAVSWHEHTPDADALRRTLFDYGVGFTAVLTKYLRHDVRFLPALARSVPLALLKRRTTRGSTPSTRLPQALGRVERRGMLLGPWLYTRSRRWARKLHLNDVIERP